MNYYFIFWMCVFPISTAICELINAKARSITDSVKPTDEAKSFAALIIVVVWLLVGYSLY
jgi:uncharacterized membrane protein